MALGLLEEKLQKAILDAYTEATLAQMLKYRLERDLAKLATGKNFEEVVFRVIQKAEEERWLADLAWKAADFVPQDQTLQALKAMFNDLVYDVPSGGDLYAAHLLNVYRPFIDRKDLRAAFKRMAADDGPRVMAISGAELSGKTYSHHLISYISQRVLAHKLTLLDVAELRGTKEPLGFLAKQIALQIGLETTDIPAQEDLTDTCWAGLLTKWLVGSVTKSGQQCWLVIDSVSLLPDLPLHVHDFVVDLCQKIDTPASPLRLVLLDCKLDSLDESLDLAAEVESLRLIEADDVKQFFEALFSARLAPADVPVQTAAALAKVMELAGVWANNSKVGQAVTRVTREILQ